jgi:hypothetical protein
MPRTPSACRSVSAVSASVLLLTACSGGGGDDTSGSASEKSAAGTTAAAGDFCSRAADLDERVEAAVASRSDDASVADAFRALATELRGMEPPAEIAGDWKTQADGLDQMADALAELDLTEPDSFAKLEELGARLSTASDNVGTYLEANCGIDTSGSSAPAS